MAITIRAKLVCWFAMKNDIDEREPSRLSLISTTRNILLSGAVVKQIEHFEEAERNITG